MEGGTSQTTQLPPKLDRQCDLKINRGLLATNAQREEKEDKEKDVLAKANQQDAERLDEITVKLADEDDEVDREALEEEMRDLEQAIEAREARLVDMDKNRKWNVDNLCHVVEERTIVSKEKDTLTTAELPPAAAKAQAAREAMRAQAAREATRAGGAAEGNATANGSGKKGDAAAVPTQPPVGPQMERHSVETYAEFTEMHEDLLEEFSEIKSLEKTRDVLHQKGDILLQENAQSYLLLSCLEDEMNGKHERMKLVARQSQIISHVVELSVTLNRPPRDVVVPFFRRISEPVRVFLAGAPYSRGAESLTAFLCVPHLFSSLGAQRCVSGSGQDFHRPHSKARRGQGQGNGRGEGAEEGCWRGRRRGNSGALKRGTHGARWARSGGRI